MNTDDAFFHLQLGCTAIYPTQYLGLRDNYCVVINMKLPPAARIYASLAIADSQLSHLALLGIRNFILSTPCQFCRLDGQSWAMSKSHDETTDLSAGADLGANEKQQTTALRSTSNESKESRTTPDVEQQTLWRRIYNIISWTPPNCRWDPENPPEFSTALNFLFAFAGAFTGKQTPVWRA